MEKTVLRGLQAVPDREEKQRHNLKSEKSHFFQTY